MYTERLIYYSGTTKPFNNFDIKYNELSIKPPKILCTIYIIYIKQIVFSENFSVTVTIYIKSSIVREYQHHNLNLYLACKAVLLLLFLRYQNVHLANITRQEFCSMMDAYKITQVISIVP